MLKETPSQTRSFPCNYYNSHTTVHHSLSVEPTEPHQLRTNLSKVQNCNKSIQTQNLLYDILMPHCTYQVLKNTLRKSNISLSCSIIITYGQFPTDYLHLANLQKNIFFWIRDKLSTISNNELKLYVALSSIVTFNSAMYLFKAASSPGKFFRSPCFHVSLLPPTNGKNICFPGSPRASCKNAKQYEDVKNNIQNSQNPTSVHIKQVLVTRQLSPLKLDITLKLKSFPLTKTFSLTRYGIFYFPWHRL